MIIYSLTINRGGLLRVTESMLDVFKHLDEDFPLRIVYFHNRPLVDLDEKKFIFQKWDEGDSEQLTDQGIEEIASQLRTKLSRYKVQRIIFESSMARYWKQFETKFSLDVHILERPLYRMLRENPGLSLIDEISPDPIVKLLTNLGFVGLKQEASIFRRADHFISNSKTTTRDLHRHYADEIIGKRIDLVPVTSQILAPTNFNPLESDYKESPSFLYFGRFHPQKGLHFLFGRSWEGQGLTIKGFDDALVRSDKFKMLKGKNIHFENWSFSGSDVAHSLSRHHFVIFSSLYEPFGLALSEALSLGKICIAHDNDSGHNEQIVSGVNGYLVDMNDGPAFDRLISDLREMDRPQLDEISKAAAESVKLRHSDRLLTFVKMLKDIVE